MKKKIVVNIGNKGSLLSVMDKNNVYDKLFINEFNSETFSIVSDFFKKYSYDSYIFIDTIAQNYNYKTFPKINIFDLNRLIKRKFNSDIPKNDLKTKKFLYRRKDGKTVFLFVSASVDSPLKEWLNFFEQIPNNLLGIYMVPLESIEYAKTVLNEHNLKMQVKKKNQWILIIFNNQVSDLRQVAIFNNKIAFTRLISSENLNADLKTFAENDIVRTVEYMKRFDSDFRYYKLNVINILESEYINMLKDLKIENARIINLTPNEISTKLKYMQKSIDKNERYNDFLLNIFALNSFKKVRFGTPSINISYILSLFFKFFKILNWFTIILTIILFFSFSVIFTKNKITSIRFHKEIEKNNNLLKSKSKSKFNMDDEELDKIIESGQVREMLDKKYLNPFDSFKRMFFLQKGLFLVGNLRWQIVNFNFQGLPPPKSSITITYNASILNPDGDPTKLFSKYDSIANDIRLEYKNELTNISVIPNNIDMNIKYLTYPLNININERR